VDPYEKAIIPKAYIQNSEERLRVYGFIEEMSKKGSFKQIKSNLKDRFGPLPLEVRDLIRCMKVKRLGANLNVDKITIKKDVLKLVFFKSRSEKEKNNTFGLLLKLFNKEGHKYAITEKNNQIIISVLGYLNLEKTLNLLKKIKV
jgi:transcription-repair coupling factor (superfamily II helicase)